MNGELECVNGELHGCIITNRQAPQHGYIGLHVGLVVLPVLPPTVRDLGDKAIEPGTNDGLVLFAQGISDRARGGDELLEQAYEYENGRRIAMTDDGTAAYYVDDEGGRIDDETYLRIRDELMYKPRTGEFRAIDKQIDRLKEHRDQNHAGMEAGDRLRDDLAAGAISAEDAEQHMEDIRQSRGAALDAAEEAILGARDEAPVPDSPAPDTSDFTETNPAGAPAMRPLP